MENVFRDYNLIMFRGETEENGDLSAEATNELPDGNAESLLSNADASCSNAKSTLDADAFTSSGSESESSATGDV